MRLRNPLRRLTRSAADPLDRWRPRPLDRQAQKAAQILDAVHATSGLPGEIVECGVGAGYSLALFSLYLDGLGDPRRLWAFDSFEGFPEGGDQDADWFSPDRMTVYQRFDVDWVRAYIAGVTEKAHLADRPTFVPGFFPASFDRFEGQAVSLLHLDVDLYQSYVDCFDFFAPRLVPGALILLDEYDRGTDETKWPGARLAADEFVARHGLTVEKHYLGFAQIRVTKPISSG